MQSTSDLYKSILFSDNHWFVPRARIAGVCYYEDTIISVITENDVFNRTMPVVGCAVDGEIDLVIKTNLLQCRRGRRCGHRFALHIIER